MCPPVSAALWLAALLLAAVACTRAQAITSDLVPFVKGLHLRNVDDYGVQHFQILGHDADWGILHILAKCVRLADDKVVFWGVGMFEQSTNSAYYRTPDTFLDNMPEMYLEGPQWWSKHPITVNLSSTMKNLPFHLHAEFVDAHHYFALKVEGWARWAYVRPRYPEEFLSPIDSTVAGSPVYTINASSQGFQRKDAPVVGVISPMHINKDFHLEEFPAMVAFHVHYHIRLGYNMLVMFLRPSLEQAMAQNRAIRELVHSKRLKLIRWNELPQHKDHVYFDQELLYNSACVMFWGHNVWFNTLDTDEFIASDNKLTSVRQVLFDCADRPADLIRLNRLEMDCPSCRSSWQIGESGDILHWRKREVPDPLKLYTRVGPFDLPDCRECKYFLNPNYAYALNPHRADLLEGGEPDYIVNTSCAYIAHLVNLVHIRHDDGEDYFNKPNKWWWLQEEEGSISY